MKGYYFHWSTYGGRTRELVQAKNQQEAIRKFKRKHKLKQMNWKKYTITPVPTSEFKQKQQTKRESSLNKYTFLWEDGFRYRKIIRAKTLEQAKKKFKREYNYSRLPKGTTIKKG